MKLLCTAPFLILLGLIFISSSLAQSHKEVYCVTTLVKEGVATVVCDAPAPLPTCAQKDDPTCTKLTRRIPTDLWPERWEKPQVRQLLKGELLNGKWVRPVLNCTPINENGEKLPLNSAPRDGCEKEPSAFIQALMRN